MRTNRSIKSNLLCSILTIAVVISALTASACVKARNPANYYLNDYTGLPDGIQSGKYILASLKYHNAKKSTNGGRYFASVADTDVEISDSIFIMGEATYENPKYHELQFEGIIRAFGTKNDKYRPVDKENMSELDMDESQRAVKRCIAIFDSDNNDTGFRLYIMDNELWVGYFIEEDDAPWVCDDLFVLKYDKIGSMGIKPEAE